VAKLRTLGDFCRRLEAVDVETLMKAINEVRMKVWPVLRTVVFPEKNS